LISLHILLAAEHTSLFYLLTYQQQLAAVHSFTLFNTPIAAEMLLTVVTSFFFATSLLAAPIDKRDVDNTNDVTVITRAMKNAVNSLNALKSALDTVSRIPQGYDLTQYEQSIERSSQDVTNTLNGGAREVRLGPSANYLEAAGLMGKVTDMQSGSSATSKSWISAKNVIVRTQGGREAALRILNDHQAAAGNFADALVNRMPGLAQGIAHEFSTPALAAVKNAIDAYKKP